MSSQIHHRTLLPPENADDLRGLALEVLEKSAALGSGQYNRTLNTLRELLRVINSCYSNLIEGRKTTPMTSFTLYREFYRQLPVEFRVVPDPGKKEKMRDRAWRALWRGGPSRSDIISHRGIARSKLFSIGSMTFRNQRNIMAPEACSG